MYNISLLQTGLSGLIGFRDTKATDIDAIDSSLISTISGSYFDDIHPLMHTDTLTKVAPNFKAENYGTWSALISYPLGTRKIYNNIAYQCTKVGGSTIGTLPSALTEWETVFSAWLLEKYNASVSNLFNRLAVEKKLNLSTKSLFEDVQLFTGAGRLQDTITNSGKMVGLQIDPKKINNIKAVLNYIGIQFSAIQPAFNVYLYHSSRKEPVAQMAITTTTAYKFEWKLLTAGSFDLNFVDFINNIDSGGHWYIAYFEDDITGNSINKSYDFEEGPCSGCSNTKDEYRIYNLWNKYVDVMPFYFLPADLDGTNLPDIEKIYHTPTTNYGLNLSLSVVTDVTALILQQKNLITYPLGLQFAYDMLTWILYNPTLRINPEQINANQQTILYERDGDANTEGMKQRLGKAISALAEDLSKISAALPDNKPTRMRYGAI
ncbi:MAG: hypothetical protein WC886_07750 [Saccharofermentanaceae bacterium]|jgi:hypothetical protein